MMPEQKAIDPNLFEWPSDQPRLFASRCNQCGNTVFPVAGGCNRCGNDELTKIELPEQGMLWSWTIQGFMPKEPYATDETPETFNPYGVGYIELDEVLVETRLPMNRPEQFEIGMPLKLDIHKIRTDEDGTEIMSYQFVPVKDTK